MEIVDLTRLLLLSIFSIILFSLENQTSFLLFLLIWILLVYLLQKYYKPYKRKNPINSFQQDSYSVLVFSCLLSIIIANLDVTPEAADVFLKQFGFKSEESIKTLVFWLGALFSFVNFLFIFQALFLYLKHLDIFALEKYKTIKFFSNFLKIKPKKGPTKTLIPNKKTILIKKETPLFETKTDLQTQEDFLFWGCSEISLALKLNNRMTK